MNQIDYDRHWTVSVMLACVALLLTLPFAISEHYAVYNSLYQDFVVVAFSLLIVLLATMSKSLKVSAPRVSYVLLAMAGYWLIQPLLTAETSLSAPPTARVHAVRTKPLMHLTAE